MYKYVLFDFDGTLADTSKGILLAMKKTFDEIGYQYNDINNYKFLIGPSLFDSFKEKLYFNEHDTLEAIKIFRHYYSKEGLFLCDLYPDIKDLLIELNRKGIKCYVASSKPTVFLKEIIENKEMSDLFVRICGSDINSNLSKFEIINNILKEVNNINDAIMIGDKNIDIVSAKKANIKSIGVTYGFGTIDEIKKSQPSFIANNAKDILNIINKENAFYGN